MPSFPLSMPRFSRLVLLLLVVLTVAVPAAMAHACSDTECDTVQLVSETAADDDGPCSDCGPACANGCCHGSHAATTVEALVIPFIVAFDQPASWRHGVTPPLADPSGPRRPPRQ